VSRIEVHFDWIDLMFQEARRILATRVDVAMVTAVVPRFCPSVFRRYSARDGGVCDGARDGGFEVDATSGPRRAARV
jgi:hypothetical protein